MARKDKVRNYPAGPNQWDTFADGAIQVFAPQSATVNGVASITVGPNTNGVKGIGTIVFVASTSTFYIATGAATTDPWKIIDVSGSVTPA